MHKVDGTLALLQTNSANDKRLQHRYQMLKASCHKTELLNDSINCRVYWDRGGVHCINCTYNFAKTFKLMQN